MHEPTQLSNQSRTLIISWNPAALHIAGEEMGEEVGRNKPSIALGAGGGGGGGGAPDSQMIFPAAEADDIT